MRRKKPIEVNDYIKVRISQLFDESNKCHDSRDAMWYNRIAQELDWVLKVVEGKQNVRDNKKIHRKK